MKDREAVKNMIRLLKELNATLSFIKWELIMSTEPFIVWLVALFLFLLFCIFTCFTLSYSSHTLNHPFVFPCSYLHALTSHHAWAMPLLLGTSLPAALFKEPVCPPRVPAIGNTAFPTVMDLYFSCLWPAVVSSNSKDGMWEVDLRRECGARRAVDMAAFRTAHCTGLDF